MTQQYQAPRKIVVAAKPDGNTAIRVEGATGTSCKDLTKALEQALGAVTEDTPTADMHAQPVGQHAGQSSFAQTAQ